MHLKTTEDVFTSPSVSPADSDACMHSSAVQSSRHWILTHLVDRQIHLICITVVQASKIRVLGLRDGLVLSNSQYVQE